MPTDRARLIADLPYRIARQNEGVLDWFDMPVQVREYTLWAAWHERKQNDPAHRWLRDRVSSLFS